MTINWLNVVPVSFTLCVYWKILDSNSETVLDSVVYNISEYTYSRMIRIFPTELQLFSNPLGLFKVLQLHPGRSKAEAG